MRVPTRSLVAGAVVGVLAASGGAVITMSGLTLSGGLVDTDVPVPTFAPTPPATAVAAPAPMSGAPTTAPSAPVTGADIAAQGLPGGGGSGTRRSTTEPDPEADQRAAFVDRLPDRMRDRIREACANDEFDGEICDYV